MMPRAALLILLTLAACSGGSGGTFVGNPPSVAVMSLPSTPSEYMDIRIVLVDEESDPVDVALEVSFDSGVTWWAGTVTDGTSLTDLPSSEDGVESHLEWDVIADLGFRFEGSAIVRVTPSDRAGNGVPGSSSIAPMDNFRAAADRVDFYFIHYGPFDAATIDLAETYDLVILHPSSGNLTRDTIADIQDGVEPNDPGDDVFVIGYISAGEDLRTVGVTDGDMLLDARFVGDGTGPRIDPRGPDADGGLLTGLDPLGLPSNGGTGYASWYLDDNSVDTDPGDVGDGLPDRNTIFGGCFVNAGDPAWFTALDAMEIDGVDGVPGMREILTLTYGRSLGCDGLFLDTIDTCAPNSFTDGTSANQSEFEWTAAGFTDFMATLLATYPDRLIIQNRGVFFFDPRHPQYAVTSRASIDFAFFESYRLNSSTSEEFNAYFFPDNKFNFAPKLMAEANRADGFGVLSLGYAEGPPADMSTSTLVGESSVGLASLLEDIREAQELAGFRHFIVDGPIQYPNSFVKENADLSDTTAPVWTSTYNANNPAFPTPPVAATPREGVQEAVAGADFVTVRWDVALDLNRVGYALYQSTLPFDFVGDSDLDTATRTVLTPSVGAGYTSGVGPAVYPYEATITGLAPATTYYFCLRAFDSVGNEEQNQVTLSATPYGAIAVAVDGVFTDWSLLPVLHSDPADAVASAGPDWLDVSIVNDGTDLFIRYTSDDAFNLDGSPTYGFSRTLIFIDADNDPSTGYSAAGGTVGSELLVAGDTLYQQDVGVFNDGLLQVVPVAPTTNIVECELSIPLSRIYTAAPGAVELRVLFFNDEVSDSAPDSGYVTFSIQP